MKHEIYLNNKKISEDTSVIELDNKTSHEEKIEVNVFNFYDLSTSYLLSSEISIFQIDDSLTISDGTTTIVVNILNKIVSIRQHDNNGVYYRLNIHLFPQFTRGNSVTLFPYRSSHIISSNDSAQHIELYMYTKDNPPLYLKEYPVAEFTDKLLSDLEYGANKIASLKKGDYVFNLLDPPNLIRINDIKYFIDRVDKLPIFIVGENVITKEISSYSLESLIGNNTIVVIPSNAYIYDTNNGRLYYDGKFIDNLSYLNSYINTLCHLKKSTPYESNIFVKDALIDFVARNQNFIPDELSEDSCIWMYDEFLCTDISSIHNRVYNRFKEMKDNNNV